MAWTRGSSPWKWLQNTMLHQDIVSLLIIQWQWQSPQMAFWQIYPISFFWHYKLHLKYKCSILIHIELLVLTKTNVGNSKNVHCIKSGAVIYPILIVNFPLISFDPLKLFKHILQCAVWTIVHCTKMVSMIAIVLTTSLAIQLFWVITLFHYQSLMGKYFLSV